MDDQIKSCTVAPLTQSNYATLTIEDATTLATNNATIDLKSLAERVLKRSNATGNATNDATMQLHSTATTCNPQSCTVALPKGGNSATQMQAELNSIEMVKQLVINVSSASRMDFLATALPSILKPFCGGSCVVILAFQHETGAVKLQLGDAWKVTPSNALIEQLRGLCVGRVTVISIMSPGDSVNSTIQKELMPLMPSLIKIFGGTQEEWIESAIDSTNESKTLDSIKKCWVNEIDESNLY